MRLIVDDTLGERDAMDVNLRSSYRKLVGAQLWSGYAGSEGRRRGENNVEERWKSTKDSI
jgi:hypothetical protein